MSNLNWRSRDENPKDGERIVVYMQCIGRFVDKGWTEIQDKRYFVQFGWECIEQSGDSIGKVIGWLPIDELNLPEIE